MAIVFTVRNKIIPKIISNIIDNSMHHGDIWNVKNNSAVCIQGYTNRYEISWNTHPKSDITIAITEIPKKMVQ